MMRYKITNLILFIALVAMMVYAQALPNMYALKKADAAHFVVGWVLGAILTLASVAVSILWYRSNKTRFSEIMMPALVALLAAWVTITLFKEWQAWF